MPSHRIDIPARRKHPVAASLLKRLSFHYAALDARLDRFCTRMIPGLTAVALVLAVFVLGSLYFRLPLGEYYAHDLQFTDGMIDQTD